MIRDEIKATLIGAMKGGDKDATQTIRLIQSAIKNRDIELRTASQQPDDDALVTEVLQKMIKQRRESIAAFDGGGRPELAAAERGEIELLQAYMPQQLSEAEIDAAIASALAASPPGGGMAAMGKIMAVLKPQLAGRADMAQVSAKVKAKLAG